ncbi:MAG: chorismate mutase [Bacteroidia bacterium]
MSWNLETLPLTEWLPNSEKPLLIAGPCSAESEEQVVETAKQIAKYFPHAIYRAGIWKPRTRPGSFEGIGEIGLEWLATAKQETGLLNSTEIATPEHLEKCLKNKIDTVWIGARTVANPFSVQILADALKGIDIPVFIKNPINLDLELWLGAIERINRAGIKKIIAIHRGFHSIKQSEYRNQPHWEIPIHLKTKATNIPLVCDVSHISGTPDLLHQTAQKALDLNMDGLMIETHINPKIALSDAEQQITPKQLVSLVSKIIVRTENSEDIFFKNRLEELRSQIDNLDAELLNLLSRRMTISKKIGSYKEENSVTILQIRRWKKILKTQKEIGFLAGLSEEFIQKIFDNIHDESIRVQNEVMNKNSIKKNKV